DRHRARGPDRHQPHARRLHDPEPAALGSHEAGPGDLDPPRPRRALRSLVRAALACLAVGSLAACVGQGGGGGGAAAKPKVAVGPAIDAKEAQQGASDLVVEIYETLGRGNTDSLFTLLNDSLIVFGPRSTDMLGTRADALVAIGQVANPKAKKKLA